MTLRVSLLVACLLILASAVAAVQLAVSAISPSATAVEIRYIRRHGPAPGAYVITPSVAPDARVCAQFFEGPLKCTSAHRWREWVAAHGQLTRER